LAFLLGFFKKQAAAVGNTEQRKKLGKYAAASAAAFAVEVTKRIDAAEAYLDYAPSGGGIAAENGH
jgi:hypothetical protein